MAEDQALVGGRYRILERLGKGAMGVVYVAHDPVLDRKVAIKQMTAEIAHDADLRQRFYVEARAAARLNHPHIITIHELQEADGEIYMVMELLEGRSLSAFVGEGKSESLPVQTTLDMMAQVCDGLDYAHQHAIVHRDIKPANLFVTSSGVVKILDFGIARLGNLRMTATGALIGTPDYMSPEQVRGDEIDSRADIWAAGAVLYLLLSGAKPFEGRPLARLLAAITQTPHAPLQQRMPDLPKAVCDLVDWMLAKPREQRPATAGIVRDELRAILGRELVQPRAETIEEIEKTAVILPGTAAAMRATAIRQAAPPATARPAALREEENSADATPNPAAGTSNPAEAGSHVRAADAIPNPAEAGSHVRAADVIPNPAEAGSRAPVAEAAPKPADAGSHGPAAPRRTGLIAALVLVVAVVVVGGGALAGWWFLGPRLLKMAGLSKPTPVTNTTLPAEERRPATEASTSVADAASSAAAHSSAATDQISAGGQPPAGAASPSPLPGSGGEAAPLQTAPPAASAPFTPAFPRTPGPSGHDAPPGPAPKPPVSARSTAAAAPLARPLAAPPGSAAPTTRPAPAADAGAAANPGANAPAAAAPPKEPRAVQQGDERPAAPRVTEQLNPDSVAALSGQRSSSGYGAVQGGSTVAAVNRINWVLEQYAAALQRRDAESLREYRPSPGAFETQVLGAREASVKLETIDVQVAGTSATARCRRAVEATLASGAPLRDKGTVTVSLTRRATGWVITDVR